MMKRSAMIAAMALLGSAPAACSSQPLEFADWMMPVADGVPVHEYGQVPESERTERIELVADLTIGERDGDDNYMLYDTFRVLAGPEGSIYVLDSGNSRVQVFDENGEYVMSLGREGQGPGEFTGANDFIIAGDRLIVRDFEQRRYSIWTLDGDHLDEVTYPSGPSPLSLQGFDDGTFMARIRVRNEDETGMSSMVTPHYKLIRYAQDAGVVNEILDPPVPTLPAITRQSATSASFMRMRVPAPSLAFDASRDGLVYVSLGEEYQVYALDREGAMRWALRVDWDRVPITDEEIETALEAARERIPDASRAEVEWPAARPALSGVLVDGHGHVYVRPYPADTAAIEDGVATVDVYDAAGRHLFSGTMPDIDWTDARGDFVYASESDDDTGEVRVIRYRLVEPWADN